MAAKACFVIDGKDNVGTILQPDLEKGAGVECEVDGHLNVIALKDKVPYGHKIAVKQITKGDRVLKYGLTIGLATEDIKPGEHVHIHNIESTRGRGDLAKGR